MKRDHDFMEEAVSLSLEGMRSHKGGPFGAVIVKNGIIIGRGNNRVTSENDPTAHAEIVAIRDACKAEKNFWLQGAVIYTSCEPCPMCLAAIYWARISKVYYANTRIDAQAIGFDDAKIYEEISLSPHKREIPFIQILREKACQVFTQWQHLQGKIPY